MKSLQYYSLLFLLLCGSCMDFSPKMQKDGTSYLYKGQEQIIISYTQNTKMSPELLSTTAKMIQMIIKNTPKFLATNEFYIEGLSGDEFSDFFMIGDSIFLSLPYFKNRTLIYGYISRLYEQFMLKQQAYPFIPLADIQKLFSSQFISAQENNNLINFTAQYAIDKIFFVSILEFLERPIRYFYPSKTKDELYRVLIYPELLGFWKSLERRFGKKMILEIAQKNYTPEDFYIRFGEKVSDLEAFYVNNIKNSKEKSKFLRNTNTYNQLTNFLYLYMSGTKRALMAE